MRVAACLLLLLSLNQDLHAQSHQSVPAKQLTLRNARLPAQVRNDIYAFVLQEITGAGPQDATQLQKMAWDSSVRFLKLGIDGSSAILVEGGVDNPLSGVNAIGNNPSWLFRQVGNRAVLLFENVGQGIGIEPTFHHGMHDISTAVRMGHSSMDVWIEVDEFDGNTYNPAYCFESTLDEDGKSKNGPRHPCS
jgi:hypothetical protein